VVLGKGCEQCENFIRFFTRLVDMPNLAADDVTAGDFGEVRVKVDDAGATVVLKAFEGKIVASLCFPRGDSIKEIVIKVLGSKRASMLGSGVHIPADTPTRFTEQREFELLSGLFDKLDDITRMVDGAYERVIKTVTEEYVDAVELTHKLKGDEG